jgi:glycylpeptide N-tetradecanoyltransferase
MDNLLFLQELKVIWSYRNVSSCILMTRSPFGSGDGLLNFYLYNWRSKALAGMNPTEDRSAGRGVGVDML